MSLIEAGDHEGIEQFFSQPKYVTKIKHIVEFTEVFRSELEKRFGYKPSYREAYEFFKANLSSMDFPKEQQRQLLVIFKELAKQSEQVERKGYQLNSITMDFKGSLDSDIDIPDPLVIAYNEALAGALMCIIPTGISQGTGAIMIGDALRRTYDYLDQKYFSKSDEYDVHQYSSHESSEGHDRYDMSYDSDSWDKEPNFR